MVRRLASEASIIVGFGKNLGRTIFRPFCKDLLEIATDFSMHSIT